MNVLKILLLKEKNFEESGAILGFFAAMEKLTVGKT